MDDFSALLRQPYSGEMDYFRQNPRVGGMATEDGRVILNPFSPLQPHEKAAVLRNEAARLAMRDMPTAPGLTPDQRQYLSTAAGGQPYGGGNNTAQRETVIGRLISGDPSAGNATPVQRSYADQVRQRMGALVRRNPLMPE
jgi:hypothetical protein